MVCKACQEGKMCPKCLAKISRPRVAPAPPAVATKATDTKQEPKKSLWARFKEGFIKAAEDFQKAMAEQEKRSKSKKGKKKSSDSWGWDFSWDFDWDDLGLEPPSSTKRRRKKSKGYRLELGGWDFY
jgi:hypothetical protein